MRSSFIDYAMSVLTDRALPDVRDGLKPSQRRILVAMNDLGLAPNKQHRKCAKIAGDTSGNYHPHGEAVIYPTLVRMAQDFNMRYTLVDGQGNFGSVEGDSPAAMRYTEARFSKIAVEMLRDIDANTVDWMPNYDETRREPKVLPSRMPNLLVNGAAGIAVGMATNIPPHNLGEVVDAIMHLVDNPEATADDLMQFIQGPGLPDRRRHPRHRRVQRGLPHRARTRPRPRQGAHRADSRATGAPSSSPSCRTRSTAPR